MKENFEEKEKTTEAEKETKEVEKEAATGEEVPTSDDMLKQLVLIGKKQLFLQRIATGCVAGMLLVMVIAVGIMIPRVTTTLNHINSVAQKAEKSLEQVDSMTETISTSAGNFDKLLKDNGEKLTNAVTSISEIDFEGLNKAITDLQNAVGPMAKFFGKFN